MQFEARRAVSDIFRPGQQREVEIVFSEDHFKKVVILPFLSRR